MRWPEVSRGAIDGAAIGILVLLFAIQRFGTARVGNAFSPIIIVWLLANAVIGACAVSRPCRQEDWDSTMCGGVLAHVQAVLHAWLTRMLGLAGSANLVCVQACTTSPSTTPASSGPSDPTTGACLFMRRMQAQQHRDICHVSCATQCCSGG